MADLKISQLNSIVTVVPATDVLPVVQGGTTLKITPNQILGSGGVASLASATITGAATVGTTLGVTGASTLASATITGDLTVDTSTLVVDATNDAVGIGTTTPNSYAFNDPAKLVIANTGTAASGNTFTIASGSTGFGQIAFANGTSGTSRYNGYIKYSHSTNAMEFYTTAGTLGMTLNTAGNLAFPTGKGIDFSATADGPTMTSELLNDYEEGAWTPVVADATTGGNVGTCTINSATYTKIGRQVSIQCDLRSITTTGMTGGNNLFIRGLPFASVKGGNGSFYTYRVGRNASTVSSAVTVEHGVSHAFLSLFTTSSANTNLSILVSDITSGTSELTLSVTYTV